MRWRAVFVKAVDDDVRSIAEAAKQLVPSLRNQIDASIISLRSPAVSSPWVVLSMVHFADRQPECTTAPSCIAEALAASVFQSGSGRDAREQLAKEPHVSLAILASRMQGDAMFVICSDTLSSSGYLRFSSGSLAVGEIFGWEGSDELWNFSADMFRSQEIKLSESEDYDYYKPVAKGLVQMIGPGADELFLSPTGGGTDGECLRYHILTDRQPISPVKAQPDAPKGGTAKLRNKSPHKNIEQPSDRPWWKFW